MRFLTRLRSEDRFHPAERRRGPGPSRRRATVRPRLELLEGRRVLSTLTVTSSSDSNSVTPGDGTLRGEIEAADQAGGGTIVFDPSLDGQTITLTAGLLEIHPNPGAVVVAIQGPGAGLLAISGNNQSRVFEVDSNTSVTISGLKIENGNGTAAGNGNGGFNGSNRDTGGGILNFGTLTLSGCTVTGNVSGYTWINNKFYPTGQGGGIYNAGTMTLSGCSVTGNVSATLRKGNGIAVFGAGGGIFNNGTMTLSACTVTGNTAFDGGGIYNDTQGHLTILSSKVTNNTTDDIFNVGWISISKDSKVGKINP
jgi:hypothetical protein